MILRAIFNICISNNYKMLVTDLNNEDLNYLSLNDDISHDILGFVLQKLTPALNSFIPFKEVAKSFNVKDLEWKHLLSVLKDEGLVHKIADIEIHLALTEKGCRVKDLEWRNYYDKKIQEINFAKEYKFLSKKVLELEKDKLEYDKQKREAKKKVKELLETAKTGIEVVNSVIGIIDGLRF